MSPMVAPEEAAPKDSSGEFLAVKEKRKRKKKLEALGAADCRFYAGLAVALLGVCGAVVAVVAEMRNAVTHDQLFQMVDETGSYYSHWGLRIGDVRRALTMAPVASDAETVFQEALDEVDWLEARLVEFKGHWRDAMRTAPALREANPDFRDMFDNFQAGVDGVRSLINGYIRAFPLDPTEAYLLAYDALDRQATARRVKMLKIVEDARKALRRVSKDSTNVSIGAITAAAVVGVAALAVTLLLLLVVYNEAKGVLVAQEKLARQQAHEMRNKYTPAIVMIDAVLDVETFDELLTLKPDLQSANCLLREVEAQHQARLGAYNLFLLLKRHTGRADCYKILRARYKPSPETFDLLAFMRGRLDAESTVAKWKLVDCQDATPVRFEVALPTALDGQAAIHVRCDHYILTHVTTNLLSNSRKYTSAGEIQLAFVGERRGLLVFQVRDTGQGIPPSIRDCVFREEVCTGDQRGTGLGLPSCRLFCKAAGGYVRLVDSRVADERDAGSGSVFEFAVAGKVVGLEEEEEEKEETDQALVVSETQAPAPARLPDNVHVVIIDDSATNRRTGTLRVRKVADAAGADGWTFAEFPTFEAARDHLHALVGPLHIVLTDHNMASMGGLATGTDVIRDLVASGFQGCIISSSGDPEQGEHHLTMGAHLNWPKPLPKLALMTSDLTSHFSRVLVSSSLSPHSQHHQQLGGFSSPPPGSPSPPGENI